MKIIATIFAFLAISVNAMAGELPTVVVMDKAGHVIIEADSALFEGKFGVWTFYDSENCRTVEEKAETVRVYNMNGEYVVDGNCVFHKNSGNGKVTRISGDCFQETFINLDVDNNVVNNEL